jgi:hypothetical protein
MWNEVGGTERTQKLHASVNLGAATGEGCDPSAVDGIGKLADMTRARLHHAPSAAAARNAESSAPVALVHRHRDGYAEVDQAWAHGDWSAAGVWVDTVAQSPWLALAPAAAAAADAAAAVAIDVATTMTAPGVVPRGRPAPRSRL